MSGYLSCLLARATPTVSEEAPPVDSVHPLISEPPHLDADPFEDTVIDPPVWPSASPSIAPPRARAAIESTTVERLAPDRRSVSEPAPAGPRDTHPPAVLRDRRVDAPTPDRVDVDAPSIAETLRPAAPVPPARHDTPASTAPLPGAEPRAVVERLAIADGFMRTVLPGALLPPEVRVERTREVVRETTDVRTVQPALTPTIQPAAPVIAGDVDPPAAGLVIGSLRVTVVPPANAPTAASMRPATQSPRVVVNRSAPPPGVPSFSRFG